MNTKIENLDKFSPGTFQRLSIKTTSSRNEYIFDLITQIDFHSKRPILIFSKSFPSDFIATQIFNRRSSIFYKKVMEQKQFNTNDKYITSLALKSNIYMLEFNQFNIRSIISKSLDFLDTNRISIIIVEGMKKNKKRDSQLRMLAMRAKCHVIELLSEEV